MKPTDRELRDREFYGSRGPKITGRQQRKAAERQLLAIAERKKKRVAEAKVTAQKIKERQSMNFQAALESL